MLSGLYPWKRLCLCYMVLFTAQPLPRDQVNVIEFVDKTIGTSISKSYMPAIKKGLMEIGREGVMSGYPIGGVRMVLKEGKTA